MHACFLLISQFNYAIIWVSNEFIFELVFVLGEGVILEFVLIIFGFIFGNIFGIVIRGSVDGEGVNDGEKYYYVADIGIGIDVVIWLIFSSSFEIGVIRV